VLTTATRAGLGFRVHSGWACLVVVARPNNGPLAIERRKLELIDRKLRGVEQPYHAAKDMKLPDAKAFLDQCAVAAQNVATASLRKAISDLVSNGFKPAGACILTGSGRIADDLAATLRSHVMIHTAEGHFFRNALQKACESCGLPAICVREKELASRATDGIRISPEHMERRISEAGKSAGPPWRQDEKLCTMAGWLVLATSGAQLS
jgi:hypothetical protein